MRRIRLRQRHLELLALMAMTAAVCAVGLAVLPLLLLVVGIAAPIAAVTLLVWAVVRHHRRR